MKVTDTLLVAFTFLLFVATVALFCATRDLVNGANKTAERQSQEMQESLAIARSTSMPFLRVYLDKYNLHPSIDSINEDTKHRPTIRIRFENIGSTPAILQKIGVRLWLIERDDFRKIPIEFNEKPLVKNDAIQSKEIRGAKVWQFDRKIDAGEIRALAAPAIKGRDYSRFYLRGFVVYDDVFDVRHIKYFLVKVRQSGWHDQKGGETYNWVQHKKIESDNADDERNT